MTGRAVNDVLSFVVFSVLDILDFVLCYTYKVIDFIVEAEWKSCYCSSSKEAITNGGTILVSEQGESKILCLTSSSKLQLEQVSDTLYTRPSLVTQVSKSTVNELKMRRRVESAVNIQQSCDHHHHHHNKIKKGRVRSKFTINSTIVEILQGRIGGKQSHPIPRWSDCDCKTCNSWASSCKDTLYVKVDGAKGIGQYIYINMKLLVKCIILLVNDNNNVCAWFLPFSRKRARRCVVHPWIYFLICILDGDAIPQLLKVCKINVPVICGRSAWVWEKSQASRLPLHVTRAPRHDRKVRPRPLQGQVIPHRGPFIRMHFGPRTCGEASRTSQVSHITRPSKLSFS